VRDAVATVPRAEVLGVGLTWPDDVLERCARLGPNDSIGIIARQGDALEPLAEMLRVLSAFPGTMYSLTAESDRPRIEGLVRRADVVVYTPQARRRVRPLLVERPSYEVAPTLTAESLARVREAAGR
jgi:GntR family transcriptional regulator